MSEGHQLPSSPAAAQAERAPLRDFGVEPQAFRIDGVIVRSLGVYIRSFLPLTLLSLAIFAPWIVVNAMSADRVSGAWPSLAWLLNLVSYPLAEGASVAAVGCAVRGERINVFAQLRSVAPVALILVGTSLLASIAMAFGILFFIVPGLIVLAAFYVAMPAAVLERTGIMESLQRSRELTRGHRWATFVLAVIPIATNIGIGAALTAAPTSVYLGLTSLAAVLTGSLGAVFATLTYVDLRYEKESGIGPAPPWPGPRDG